MPMDWRDRIVVAKLTKIAPSLPAGKPGGPVDRWGREKVEMILQVSWGARNVLTVCGHSPALSRLRSHTAEPRFSMDGLLSSGSNAATFSTTARFLDRIALLETFDTGDEKSPNPSGNIQITRIKP